MLILSKYALLFMAQSTKLYNTSTYLCRKVRLPNECLRYDTKRSDGEIPAMLELWRMQSNPLLPSLPGPLWLRMIVLDRILSMVQIELNSVLMLN